MLRFFLRLNKANRGYATGPILGLSLTRRREANYIFRTHCTPEEMESRWLVNEVKRTAFNIKRCEGGRVAMFLCFVVHRHGVAFLIRFAKIYGSTLRTLVHGTVQLFKHEPSRIRQEEK